MGKLPAAKHSLICEIVRAEAGQMYSILGFFGICPDATLRYKAFPVSPPLSFLVICGPTSMNSVVEGLELEILGPDKVSIQRMPYPLELKLEQGKGISIAAGFTQFPMQGPGTYALRIFDDGDLHSEHEFIVQLESGSL